jgi:hypothetical protein
MRNWWECGLYECQDDITAEYMNDLKLIASFQGVSSEDVDELIAEGVSLMEIEEYLYGM